jgi:3-isopropylmalate/(R)-2-methylmalate dehydratase small subunit
MSDLKPEGHSRFDPFKVLTSGTVVMPQENIDTDQIIPARFLTTTSREGLGKLAFNDWRYDRDGRPLPDFILNQVDPTAHRILVAGRNFGCGSSREHAPWALTDYGFRAVISTEIADIFTSNALKNGLLPVVVDEETHARLSAHPGETVTVDLEAGEVRVGNHVCGFKVEAFARRCLLDGVDTLGWLTGRLPAIEAFEQRRSA